MQSTVPGTRLGATIGLVGATAFVQANRQQLPHALSLAALVVWLVTALAGVWAVWVRTPTPSRRVAHPTPRAGTIYTGAVVGMVVLIALGSRLLSASHHTDLVPALIAALVGLHFLPFARAFDLPFFRVLGGTMCVLGVAGLLLGAVVAPSWAAGAAVLTGLTMTVLILADGLRR